MGRLWMTGFRCCVLLVSAIWALGGCGQGEVDRLRSELADSRQEIRSLADDKERLKQQKNQLRTEFMDLYSMYEDLKAREARLGQWALQLAERFGPAVWYFGQEERPLPVHTMADAGPEQLLAELNNLFAADQLPETILVRIEDGVAFVRIDDEEQLTQSMGSAGATGYIQAVTYTLCSLPAIVQVDFDFMEGDHAVPGRYSR